MLIVFNTSVLPCKAGGFSKAGSLGGKFMKQEMMLQRQAIIDREVSKLVKNKVPRNMAYRMAGERANAEMGAKWNKVTAGVFIALTVAEIGWSEYNRLSVENPALLKKIMAELSPFAQPNDRATVWEIAWRGIK